MGRLARQVLGASCAVLAATSGLWAVTLEQMNLARMCANAHRIFRGTVIEVASSSVEAGGGTLPTMTYRILVDDTLKGTVPEVEGKRIVEIRMLGKAAPVRVGTYERVGTLGDLPVLEVGQSYVLFTTEPSSIGLSTTVGLGQGCFRVTGHGEKAQVVNGYDNVGLFDGDAERAGLPARGPVSYDLLAERIRDRVAAEGRGP